MSILYKYHISPWPEEEYTNDSYMCRSFISIIFPEPIQGSIQVEQIPVSILYKYHISLKKVLLSIATMVSVDPL